MTRRAACYCPSNNPEITCAACVPARCACGREVPVHVLRDAFRRNKGVRCTACGARKGAVDVAIEYMGL